MDWCILARRLMHTLHLRDWGRPKNWLSAKQAQLQMRAIARLQSRCNCQIAEPMQFPNQVCAYFWPIVTLELESELAKIAKYINSKRLLSVLICHQCWLCHCAITVGSANMANWLLVRTSYHLFGWLCHTLTYSVLLAVHTVPLCHIYASLLYDTSP